MTTPQEDAELRDRIGLWKWGGDFHRYIYGDSVDGPSERAIIQLDEIMSLIKARDEQREREAFEKGRQVGQFQASDKLYSHVTTMFVFKDNFDPKPRKQLSQVAFDLLKDCEGFMNANSKVYADYLMEIANPQEQDKEEE